MGQTYPSVHGIPKNLRRFWARALAIEGITQSTFLLNRIKRYVRDQQAKYGEDLFQVLSEEEKDILAVIDSGAAEIQHIAEEALLTESKAQRIIAGLIDCGYVEERKRGGKTDMARGAATKMYFVTEKYSKISK
jgi:predicted transcriptional regulator